MPLLSRDRASTVTRRVFPYVERKSLSAAGRHVGRGGERRAVGDRTSRTNREAGSSRAAVSATGSYCWPHTSLCRLPGPRTRPGQAVADPAVSDTDGGKDWLAMRSVLLEWRAPRTCVLMARGPPVGRPPRRAPAPLRGRVDGRGMTLYV